MDVRSAAAKMTIAEVAKAIASAQLRSQRVGISPSRRSTHNTPMPNIASVLKEEIARIARKEVRGETASLKKAASSHRAEIAALKRRIQALDQELRRLTKASPPSPPAKAEDSGTQRLRFSAKGLASQRKRLGLSVAEVGLLLGASGQSIYNWEAGDARPRASYLPAIAALKTLGKKDAVAHLNALKASGK